LVSVACRDQGCTTPEVVDARQEAYDALAGVFIQRERAIYKERNDAWFPVGQACWHELAGRVSLSCAVYQHPWPSSRLASGSSRTALLHGLAK
jgi:hypothetical protein